jgi:UTP--glucose-1-phosphate uridylyltransferase
MMTIDWIAIGNEVQEQLAGLSGVFFDLDRIAAQAEAIAAGRFGPEQNRLPGDPEPLGPSELDRLEAFSEQDRSRYRQRGREALRAGQVAVAVLNGGMATRFGGAVKGVMEALGGRSFLEIKHAQARAEGAPFLIMNSFATHRATLDALSQQGIDGDVEPFLQSVSIRLTTAGVPYRDAEARLSLYAPGHGDFPQALRASGLLERLGDRGVRVVMLSNVDNLGADLDPLIVGYHLESGRELSCEVAPTAEGDAGGSPARVGDGVEIVEGFRFPEGFDFSRQHYLATNSFLLSLSLLAAPHELSWFYVEKKVAGETVVQMEHLVNELSARVPSNYLAVPRDGEQGRFFPVKTLDDLEALRSDAGLAERFGRV